MIITLHIRSEVPEGFTRVNVTSKSANPLWRQLSPFHLGPVDLWDGFVSQNVENAWQYSKVYKELGHIGSDGFPNLSWTPWACNGWWSPKAVRYPAGKGAKPAYSFWNGERLDYVTARKRIYCPLYAQAVEKTEAWTELQKLAKKENIAIVDFDAYRTDKPLIECLNDPTRKFGHSFVLHGMLTDNRCWENK